MHCVNSWYYKWKLLQYQLKRQQKKVKWFLRSFFKWMHARKSFLNYIVCLRIRKEKMNQKSCQRTIWAWLRDRVIQLMHRFTGHLSSNKFYRPKICLHFIFFIEIMSPWQCGWDEMRWSRENFLPSHSINWFIATPENCLNMLLDVAALKAISVMVCHKLFITKAFLSGCKWNCNNS